MSQCMPWSRNTCCVSNWAVSRVEGSLGSAMKWLALEKRSIMVRMAVLPEEGGKPIRVRLQLLGVSDYLLDLPREGSQDTRGWQDGLLPFVLVSVGCKLA